MCLVYFYSSGTVSRVRGGGTVVAGGWRLAVVMVMVMVMACCLLPGLSFFGGMGSFFFGVFVVFFRFH